MFTLLGDLCLLYLIDKKMNSTRQRLTIRKNLFSIFISESHCPKCMYELDFEEKHQEKITAPCCRTSEYWAVMRSTDMSGKVVEWNIWLTTKQNMGPKVCYYLTVQSCTNWAKNLVIMALLGCIELGKKSGVVLRSTDRDSDVSEL